MGRADNSLHQYFVTTNMKDNCSHQYFSWKGNKSIKPGCNVQRINWQSHTLAKPSQKVTRDSSIFPLPTTEFKLYNFLHYIFPKLCCSYQYGQRRPVRTSVSKSKKESFRVKGYFVFVILSRKASSASSGSQEKSSHETAQVAFKLYDRDKDGYITKAEMVKISKTLTKEQVEKVWNN